MPRYDAIGHGYAKTRRADPTIAAAILQNLGNAKSVVNVGAGAGSYEPTDRHVIAIEPSEVMARQRKPHQVPAIRSSAGALPLHDNSVDAAMCVLSIHHWDGERERGVSEIRRVTRGPVVFVTYDPAVSGAMWLLADYLPEIAKLDHQIFPTMAQLRQWLGGQVTITTLSTQRDTPDWNLGSFWAHPERVLDEAARNATSGFARMADEVVKRAVAAVREDLTSGAWDKRYGHLRKLDELDVGLRLVVATP